MSAGWALRREWLLPFSKGVKERMCVNGVGVFEEGVRMLFLMSRLRGGASPLVKMTMLGL